MEDKREKQFFAKHNKSSALVVSLCIHAAFIIVALFFVAVTVIQTKETDFAAKPVNRPRMNLRKLQVPVKKPAQQPKLRKTIVVKPNLNRITPDLKMPEIVGVKGGLGAGAGGFGMGASLGFTMPELNLFGVKGKGEKVFIILDSSPEMMYDKMGGIPAYTIIKQELVRTLGSLSSAAQFNVAVYSGGRTIVLFPELVQASDENVSKVEQWLKPLNAVTPDMGSDDYGIKTLPNRMGSRNDENFVAGELRRERAWYHPVALAMKQQADTIFLLTCEWGNQWHATSARDNAEWYESSAGRRWQEAVKESKVKLEEENRRRAARGDPPMVISGDRDRVGAFFPNVQRPPGVEKYRYSPKEFVEALLEIRNKFRPVETQAKLGIQQNRSASNVDFSLNVIHFRPVDAGNQPDGNFNQLASLCDGEYRSLEGLEAIERSVQ